MKSKPSPGAQLTVVVTGVGAIIGQGIVRSLRLSGRPIRVIGVDRNPDSLGGQFCDAFHCKPACDETSPDYLAFWLDMLGRESVDLVLPGLEVDVFFLNANRQCLQETGVVLGLNRPELIEIARDKWLMGLELPKVGLAVIPTILELDWQSCIAKLGAPPFLLKPRQGNGSRGIVRIADETDLCYWGRGARGNAMLQKIVGSDEEEYTVGAFGLGDGSSLKPIIFRRRLSSAGNTQYAEVVSDPSIEQATFSLSAYFKPVGPTNYQFRKEGGTPYLLEINPRLSSSASLRAGFGYNEAEMTLDYYLAGMRPAAPKIVSGRAWRYSEDFFLK
jgi:carbamoyl-phosphate synthase large subunit